LSIAPIQAQTIVYPNDGSAKELLATNAAVESKLAQRRQDNVSEMRFEMIQFGEVSAHLNDVEQACELMKLLGSTYLISAFVSYRDPVRIFNLDITSELPALLTYMLIQFTKDNIVLLQKACTKSEI